MNTPNEPSSDRLEQRSRELFDISVANHDARTRSRLNQARHAALDMVRGRAPVSPLRWLLPVGTAAALGMVTLTAVQFMRADNETPAVEAASVAGAVDDLEIIASSEELEMLQDVEFYAWLETQSVDAASDISASETG